MARFQDLWLKKTQLGTKMLETLQKNICVPAKKLHVICKEFQFVLHESIKEVTSRANEKIFQRIR